MELLSLAQFRGRFPERVVEMAVKRMMPKESPLARKQLAKLRVYAGAEHPHSAQQPAEFPGSLNDAWNQLGQGFFNFPKLDHNFRNCFASME